MKREGRFNSISMQVVAYESVQSFARGHVIRMWIYISNNWWSYIILLKTYLCDSVDIRTLTKWKKHVSFHTHETCFASRVISLYPIIIGGHHYLSTGGQRFRAN